MFISLRRQLTLSICGLILLTLTLTLLISYSLVLEHYEQKMHDDNSAMAESLASNITQLMQNAYAVGQLAAGYPGFAQLDATGKRSLLDSIVNQYPVFQVAAVLDLKGNQLAKSNGLLANRSENCWFKRFIAEQKPFISRACYSPDTEHPVTVIVHGIYANGGLTGLFTSDIELHALQELVESYHSGAGSYAYLLDGEGTVLAHPDKYQVAEVYNYKTMKKKVPLFDAGGRILRDAKNNELVRETDFAVAPSLQAIIAKVMEGHIGVAEYTDLNGEEYISAYRTIILPGVSDPWSLIVVQKKSAAMAFMGYITLKTTLVGLTVMAICGLLAFWFSRRITQPLLAMANAANRIKDGDLTVELAVQSANELGVLVGTFNQMVRELRGHREHLEDLVEARTQELAAANQEMLSMNEELTTMNEVLADTNQRLNDENIARCQTEARLLLRERQCRAITGLLTRPGGQEGTGDILETILRNAVELLGAAAGYIGLFDADGEKFQMHHGVGVAPDRFSELYSARLGMIGHVYSTGEIFYVEDYRVYSQRIKRPIFDDSASSVIMVPLKHGTAVKGVLALGWLSVIHPVSTEDAEGLRQFGDLASVALEQDTAQKRIKQIAFHDRLTGLPNRASLLLYLEAEMERVHSGTAAGIILYIDIDDLKTVNDHFGHSFGDMVIVSAGCHIFAAAGETAFVFHCGGDEFIVVLPGDNSRERAGQIAGAMIDELCKEYEVAAEKVHMSASIGVAIYPDDGDTAEDILKKADSAMYAAKQAGRNSWRFYEPVLLQEAYEKITLTNGLRRGVERNEFSLQYQPQFTARGDRIVGFEALLRWNSSEHGFVSPDRFIPLAERSGLILPIGQWVLREACRFARRLSDSGWENIRVAVNISPRQLRSDDFVAGVQRSIESAGINPCQIEIEITESVLIEFMEESVHKLRQLQEIGVMLSLDDFGTGYSSMTYLRSLPVGVLKIDKSFIDQIGHDHIQRQVVGTIIHLGHALGMSIVAEGVETEEQLGILSELGCDCIQGYVFSKPLAEADAVRVLSVITE